MFMFDSIDRGERNWGLLLGAFLLIPTGCAGESVPDLRPDAEQETPATGADSLTASSPGTNLPVNVTGRPALSFTGPVLGDLPPLPGDPDGTGEADGPWTETERDWAIASGTVEWARSQALGSLPVAEVAAILGSTFVGTPYEPGTLEIPGPERLVVNLRTFDCVTLVEHTLVLARLTVDPAVEPQDAPAFRDRYRAELIGLRYRGGELDGYASRLHYFTEWLDHGIAQGLMDEVTGDLGGIEDPRPIHFMSNNPDAYRQLRDDPTLVEVIADIERRLTAEPRLYIPQESIREVEDGIRTGDIIAAVSTVDGLDIAHTGFAFRIGGRVHLLHAPLVGDSVEVSPLPLAERISGIRGQKGIRVVRPR
jgi:hypothetical protein